MNKDRRVRTVLQWAVAAQIIGLLASLPLVFEVTPLKLTLFLTVGQTSLFVCAVLYIIAVILDLRSERIL